MQLKRTLLTLCLLLLPLCAQAQFVQNEPTRFTLLTSALESAALQVYVDCSQPANGDGSLANPYNTLASLNFGPGGANSFYDARGNGQAGIANIKPGTCHGTIIPGYIGTTLLPLVIRGYGDLSGGLPIITGGDAFYNFAGPDGYGQYSKSGVTTQPLTVIQIATGGAITMLLPGTLNFLASNQWAWTNNTLYLGFNPAGTTIEAAQRDSCIFTNCAGYLEIQGISCRDVNNDLFTFSHSAWAGGYGDLSSAYVVLRNVEAHYDMSIPQSDGVTAHDNVRVDVLGYKASYVQRAMTTVATSVANCEDFQVDHCAYLTETDSGISHFRRGTVDSNTTGVVRILGPAASYLNLYFEDMTVTGTPAFLYIAQYSPPDPSFVHLQNVFFTGQGYNTTALYLNSPNADVRIYDSTLIQTAATDDQHVIYGVPGSTLTMYGTSLYGPYNKYNVLLSAGMSYTGDYNNFWRESPANDAGLNSGSGYQTLPQWRTSTGQDTHSTSVYPF